MYLTVDETAAYLGVSANWVRERIDAGDALISRHLKCRRKSSIPKRVDRSPVRIWSRDLASYVLQNRRDHGWAAFESTEDQDTEILEELERSIWTYIRWFRTNKSSNITEKEGEL